MKTLTIATLSLIALVGLAYAGTAEGKELYNAKCASCHGANGEGKPAIAKILNVTQKHLGSKEVQAKSDADLKKAILEGQGKMRPIAGVNAKQADDVVAFVRTLKQ
ncbi:MAG TPA: cytochrome c [Bryobacteraceae bacterium]|jgi:mono/diheme cytochrome c family protein|nr:cytochrome c [Bryobacteraceae bacterium]